MWPWWCLLPSSCRGRWPRHCNFGSNSQRKKSSGNIFLATAQKQRAFTWLGVFALARAHGKHLPLLQSMQAPVRISADPTPLVWPMQNCCTAHAGLHSAKRRASLHTYLSSNARPATSFGCNVAYCMAIWPPALCPTRMKGPGAMSGTAANRFFRASVFCRSNKQHM